MPKCVACSGYATHVAKKHPLCNYHASLMPNAERVLPDDHIPHCKVCHQPLSVSDWNSEHFMFSCVDPKCTLYFRPQGGESKHEVKKEVAAMKLVSYSH